MTEFRFNFDLNQDDKTIPRIDKEPEIVLPCREIIAEESSDEYVYKPIMIRDIRFDVRDLCHTNELQDAEISNWSENHDVVPSIYEGGLKIWECTFDMLQFLIDNDTPFKGKTVLDLGCGSGLLGMYASLRGASVVHFQDFNVEVIRTFTIPNVKKNCDKSQFKFIAGDWSSFIRCPAVENVAYDYILCSEVLYNVSNYERLCKIFSTMLQSGGKILIASKAYYFGVGGSTERFTSYLDEVQLFNWTNVWKYNGGVQREIISLQRIDS